MNSPTKSEGICGYCGKTFSRVSMTRHLKACDGLPAKPPRGRSFHLIVEGRHAKDYWLHIAVPVDAPLEQLDAFLRDIWLECCGHLSGFTIEGRSYSEESPAEEFWESDEDADDEEGGMETALSQVLAPGTVFSYEYDYGSTTALKLKVVGELERGTRKGRVELMARNVAPEVACKICHKATATQICTDCESAGEGWLCQSCAAKHPCGLDVCLPVVNSPRAGVCGYTG